jgi:hypothetical protein
VLCIEDAVTVITWVADAVPYVNGNCVADDTTCVVVDRLVAEEVGVGVGGTDADVVGVGVGLLVAAAGVVTVDVGLAVGAGCLADPVLQPARAISAHEAASATSGRFRPNTSSGCHVTPIQLHGWSVDAGVRPGRLILCADVRGPGSSIRAVTLVAGTLLPGSR